MKRVVLAILLLAFLLPSQAGPSTETSEPESVQRPTVILQLQAVEDLKAAVQAHGQNLDLQGILIETLDGRQALASENADSLFNPASVMKLATSLVALSKLGPDYRYRTDVLADGRIDRSSRRLEGDLVIEGGADPMFALGDAQEMARKLGGIGIARVTGSLRLAGPFYYFATGYHSNLSRETLTGFSDSSAMEFIPPPGPRSGIVWSARFADRRKARAARPVRRFCRDKRNTPDRQIPWRSPSGG